PPEEKRLLQTAAVIGTEVPMPVLQAIAEMPEEGLHHSLAHLQAAEFLYETRLFPEPEYTFAHALTHEVAYGGLLQERRRVRQAPEKVMARLACPEAVGYFEQALNALPHLPGTRETHEQAIDLRLALHHVLSESGDLGRILVNLREAETLAVAHNDPRRLGQV